MTKWIKSCLSPQNAFGQVPDAEAHSAATYCALAALKFLNQEVIFDYMYIKNPNYFQSNI